VTPIPDEFRGEGPVQAALSRERFSKIVSKGIQQDQSSSF